MFRLKALSERPDEAIAIAADHAPYLAKLNAIGADVSRPDAVIEQAHGLCAAVSAGSEDAFKGLRQAKKLAHLAIAAKDLSGQAELAENPPKEPLSEAPVTDDLDQDDTVLVAEAEGDAQAPEAAPDMDEPDFIPPAPRRMTFHTEDTA